MNIDQFGDPLPLGAITRIGSIRLHSTVHFTAAAFAPDDQTLASGGKDQAIRFWNVATGKELNYFEDPGGEVSALAFTMDGKLLASGSATGSIGLWETARATSERQLPGHKGEVYAFAFSADGALLASGAADNTIRFWEVATGQELGHLGEELGQFSTLAIATDNKTLATATWQSTVRLLDIDTSKEIRQLGGFRSRPQALAFSPDGKTLAIGTEDGLVTLWEIFSGQERGRFKGHQDGLYALAFSWQGQLLASVGADCTILIWDVTGGRDTRPMAEHIPAQQLETWWADLASPDAGRAYRTIWTLAARPGVVIPFLRERYRFLQSSDALRFGGLIADLGHSQLAVREKATAELAKLGGRTEPHLRQVLASQPSAEVRRRAERLLEKLDGPIPTPDMLPALRLVETLELMKTPESRKALAEISQEVPQTRLARVASASLERLSW